MPTQLFSISYSRKYCFVHYFLNFRFGYLSQYVLNFVKTCETKFFIIRFKLPRFVKTTDENPKKILKGKKKHALPTRHVNIQCINNTKIYFTNDVR